MLLSRLQASLFMVSFWVTHGFWMDSNGEIKPSDAIYSTGETLWMNCTLSSSYTKPCNASHMYFQHNELALTDYQHVLDDRTLKLVIPNVHPVDHHGYYYCYMNETSCGGDTAIQLMAVDTARVGDPPPNVTDFICISKNFEDLTCTWSPCHNDNNYAATRWSLEWRFVFIQGEPSSCSVDKGECGCYLCGTSNISDQEELCTNTEFHKSAMYTFTVLGKNDFGDSQAEFQVYTGPKLVKPDAPQWVQTEVLNATSIHVWWTHPARLEPAVMPQVYWLTYTSQWGEQLVNITTGTEPSYLLTNLRPHTLYKFVVRVKPQDGGYLGDPAGAENTTLESVPGEAPFIAAGSYQTSSIQCVKSPYCRTVHPFWQAIEEKQHNGEILGYQVNWTHQATVQQQTMQLDAGPDVYSAGLDLDLQGDYIISVQAYTKAGLGPASFLPIPYNGPGAPRNLEAETTSSNDAIWFTFLPPEGMTKVESYTLFGCANPTLDRYTCQGSPWTKMLDGDTVQYLHVKSNSSSEVYSVAANTLGGSSGLGGDWLCIYRYNGEAGQPTLRFSNDQQERSLRVEWDPLVCDAQNQGKVTHYVIYHQEYDGQVDLNGTSVAVNKTLAANISTFFIDNLKPNKAYLVQLEAYTRMGPGKRGSDVSKTMESVPSCPPQNVTVMKLTSSEISVAWEKPLQPNGLILGYSVKTMRANGQVVSTQKLPPDNMNLSLVDLDGYVEYSIGVAAENAKGFSPTASVSAMTGIRGLLSAAWIALICIAAMATLTSICVLGWCKYKKAAKAIEENVKVVLPDDGHNFDHHDISDKPPTNYAVLSKTNGYVAFTTPPPVDHEDLQADEPTSLDEDIAPYNYGAEISADDSFTSLPDTEPASSDHEVLNSGVSNVSTLSRLTSADNEQEQSSGQALANASTRANGSANSMDSPMGSYSKGFTMFKPPTDPEGAPVVHCTKSEDACENQYPFKSSTNGCPAQANGSANSNNGSTIGSHSKAVTSFNPPTDPEGDPVHCTKSEDACENQYPLKSLTNGCPALLISAGHSQDTQL